MDFYKENMGRRFNERNVMTDGIRNLLKHGTCDMVQEDTNKVICQDDEIKMINIRNRKRGKSENDDESKSSTTS